MVILLSTIKNMYKLRLRNGIHTKAIVSTRNGKVQGKLMKLPSGKSHYSFQGVPYAKPPVGKLRFKAPVARDPWSGTLDATREANVCPQIDWKSRKIVGDEDCLYLNVHTPSLDTTVLKPVMVWIHGGGFRYGSGNSELYNPNLFMEENVVVVTFNFRLGAFGFLNLQNEDIPGNAGLKDQIAVLRWVKENINAFGGDPNNVTLFGQSSGGVCVHYHMMIDNSKDLFHKAILQSGTAVCDITISNDKSCHTLAQILGSSEDKKVMYNTFMKTTATNLVNNYLKIGTEDHKRRCNPIYLGVILEKYAEHGENTLVQPPSKLLWKGNHSNIPILMGFNNSEGLTTASVLASKLDKEDLDIERFIPKSIQAEVGSEKSRYITHLMRKFYFNNRSVCIDTLPELVRLLSDFIYRNDAMYIARVLPVMRDNPMFLYRFSFDGKLNLYKKIYSKNYALSGATHTDELSYLFSSVYDPEVDPNSDEAILKRRMVRMWSNFARTGQPTPNEDDPLLPIYWPPVSRDKLTFLNIDKELFVDVNPDNERTDFWDSIYEFANGTNIRKRLKNASISMKTQVHSSYSINNNKYV